MSVLRRVFGRPRPPALPSVSESRTENKPDESVSPAAIEGAYERHRTNATITWLERNQDELERRLAPYEALKELRSRG